MQNKYNFQTLLDLDYLEDSQQKDIESMVQYKIEPYKIEPAGKRYWLTIMSEENGAVSGRQYEVKGLELESSGYKRLMYWLLNVHANKLILNEDIAAVEEILTNQPESLSDEVVSFDWIMVGSKKVNNKAGQQIKSQDLYKAVMVLKRNGLILP